MEEEIVVMKTCKHCQEEKPMADIKFKGGRATCYCRYCYNRYKKGRRLADGTFVGAPRKAPITEEQRRERKRLSNRRRDVAVRKLCNEFMKNYLAGRACMDCGYSNMIALDMDHRQPTEKQYSISGLLTGGRLARLKEEIEKCDVVCANCHRIRTAKMFGSWRLELDISAII